MGKTGKILAPIVAFLAVMVAFFCYLAGCIFSHQEERTNKTTEVLIETAVTLDQGNNTQMAEKLTFRRAEGKEKASGTLSWKAYLKEQKWTTYLKKAVSGDHPQYKELLDSVKTLAEKVIAQRNAQSEAMQDVTKRLGMPADKMAPEALNGLETYGEKLTLAKNYANAFRQTYDALKNSLNSIARIAGVPSGDLGKLPTCGNGAAVTAPNMAPCLKQIENKVTQIKGERQQYLDALKAIRGNVPKFNWTYVPAKLEQSAAIPSVLRDLAKDLRNVNGKLEELERTKAELARTKQALAEERKRTAMLEKKLKEKEELLRQREAELGAYKNAASGEGGEVSPVVKKPLTTLAEVDPKLEGLVLKTNPDWNYVIVNLGRYQIVEKANVVFAMKDGTYIGRGVVRKVEDDVCIVDFEKTLAIPEGSRVLLSSMQSVSKAE